MDAVRFVILHYHILKNAGSTVEEILDRSFGERFHRYDTPEREGTIPPREVATFVEAHPQVQAFSSHQIRYPLPQSPDTLYFDICFLRDPLDRVRSMYDYFRKRPARGDAISDLACHTTLGDFIAVMVADHPLHVTNVQVNLLAQAGDSDEPTRDDLNIARQHILRASFPGVVDQFEESAVAGEYFLRAAFPSLDCALPPVNVSRGIASSLQVRLDNLRAVCAPSVHAKLLALNQLDYELLACAREEVTRRFHLVPNHAERLNDLRTRVAACAAETRPVQPAVHTRPFSWLTRLRARLLNRVPELSAHFDAAFYLERYPDVRAAGLKPLRHYVEHGAQEGRKPNRLFDPAFYVAGCPAAVRAEAAQNPLLHFLSHHAANPHPLVDRDAPVVPADTVPPGPVVNLTIGDVPVAAAVWLDDAGRMQFRAPAQQRRFFQAANYDQLRAFVAAP